MALVQVEGPIELSNSTGFEQDGQYIKADGALIFATVTEALGRISDQLQYLWKVKECTGAIVIQVQEEGEEGWAADPVAAVLPDEDDHIDDVDSSLSGFADRATPSRVLVPKKRRNDGTKNVRTNFAPKKQRGQAPRRRTGGTAAKDSKRIKSREYQLLSKVIEALETDLSNNFAEEYLKKTLQTNG